MEHSCSETEPFQKADPAEPVKNVRLSRQNRPGRARRFVGRFTQTYRSQLIGGL